MPSKRKKMRQEKRKVKVKTAVSLLNRNTVVMRIEDLITQDESN